MLTTQNLKRLLLLIAAYFSVQAVRAQSSIMAGQTAGVQVIHPNNLFFYTENQPPYPAHQLDVDRDNVDDFALSCVAGSFSYNLVLISLDPTEWQVLLDDNYPSGSAQSVPVAGSIGPSSPGYWYPSGNMLYSYSYNGIGHITGNWGTDTLTRYIGIRQLKNGQWRYGYLKTKRLAPSYSSPVYVTAYAMQGVVTGLGQPQLVGVAIYPNPAQTVFQIKSPQASKLRIYNTLGSLQYEEKLAAGVTPVSVSNWSSGIYIVRLENQYGVYTSRFQKTE